MMAPAKNLKLHPEGPTSQEPAKGRQGFTTLDNEQDTSVLYALDNALVKPALVLLAHRKMRPIHWGEVAQLIGRGHTQVQANLQRLADLGHAVGHDGQWAWAGSKAAGQLELRKTGRKPVRKSVRKSGFNAPKNDVWVGKSVSPKEVKLSEAKKINPTNNVSSTNWPAQPAPVGVAGGQWSEQIRTPARRLTARPLARPGPHT
ncbi:hypothetical protein [Deinococcus multiflagellatus]|uniref:Helix-turn-helix domain-containing protein n=1 Tax=Deinococcus multiflagellatus TaxID=1656887 RepID=A0ABW1ZHV6_9DEIO